MFPTLCGDADKGGMSLFEKETSLPYTLPEKIFIASEQLEELRCLPIALPIAPSLRKFSLQASNSKSGEHSNAAFGTQSAAE